jgi:hypothetical protein
MAHWSDEYMQMITDCENREGKMTDWERGFIDSLKKWIEGGSRPTPKQIERLDEIWEKVT